MAITTGAAILGGAIIGGATSLLGASKAAGASKDAAGNAVGEQARQYNQTRADLAPYREAAPGSINALRSIYEPGYGGMDVALSSDEYKKAYDAAFTQWAGSPEGKTVAMEKSGRPGHGGGAFSLSRFAPTVAAAGDLRRQFDQLVRSGKINISKTRHLDAVDPNAEFTKSPGYNFVLNEGLKGVQRSAAARGRLYSGATLKGLLGYGQGLASNEWGNYVGGLQSLAGVAQNATNATAAGGANKANQVSNIYQNQGAQTGSAYLSGAEGVNNAVQGGLGNYVLYKYLKP